MRDLPSPHRLMFVAFHLLSAPGHGGVYVQMTGLSKAGALGNGGGIR